MEEEEDIWIERGQIADLASFRPYRYIAHIHTYTVPRYPLLHLPFTLPISE